MKFRLPVLIGLALCVPSAPWAARARVELSGQWRFRLDPDRVGIADRWFAAPLPDAGPIRVPGCWEAQGYGQPTADVKHSFVGWGWYERTVNVPGTWRGRRIFLHLGPVHRSAQVFANGAQVGAHLGYVTSSEYDITDNLRLGEDNRLTILVDSSQHPDVDALAGCLDTYDFLKWGGIYGHCWLEARETPWLQDFFVRSGAGCTQARVTANLVGPGWNADDLAVSCRLEPLSAGQAFEAKGSFAENARNRLAEVIVPTPDALAWSPEHPNLYVGTLTLRKGGRVLDEVSTRCGLREIEVRGNDIYLNGRRIFLRGYGDDCCFPLTVCPPADKALYLRRFRVARDYGFTYVRHHSHVPVQEYFDAADEVGFLIQPELPIAYKQHIDNATPAAKQLFRDQWRDLILQYRNHPSVAIWCMGNELWPSHDLGQELYAAAKALDPTRPVCDMDGLFAPPLQAAASGDTRDIAHVQFNESTIPWGPHRDKYELSGPPARPVTIHEMSNYVAFYDVRDAAKYTGLVKPSWLVGAAQATPTVYHSPRGEKRPMYYVRQMGEPWSLEWETAPVPPGAAGRVALVWTGATGFVSEPSGSFTLHLNGKPLITFNCAEERPSVWRSSDGGAELRFDVREAGIDQFGVMCLILPADRLPLGRPARLRVTGSDSASRRWFGVYDYRDTVAFETRAGTVPQELEGATLVDGFARVLRWTTAEGASVLDIAKQRGTVDLLPTFVANSRKLQALCLKLNIEAARRSREIDGYAQWLLQDYWKGGQGVLNQFYEPKGLSAEEAQRINGPTVVLLDRDRCVYTAGETIAGRVLVSHFGEQDLRNARLTAALLQPNGQGNGEGLPSVHLRATDSIPAGTVTELRPIELTAPDLAQPARLRLQLTLSAGAESWQNAWDVWVFPEPRPLETPERVGMLGGRAYTDVYPGVRQLSAAAPMTDAPDLIIAGSLTRDLLARLSEGQRVLLLSRTAFAGDTLRFKSPWWFPTGTDTNLGTIIADHPALGDFPHDHWCDLDWFEMVEGATAVHHRDALAVVPPIIQAIDLPTRQLTRSLLFEIQVDEGRLLVCSLNLDSQLVRTNPAARRLLDGLIRYPLSDQFRPQAKLTVGALRGCLAGRPEDTTLVEGFARIVAAAPDPHSGQTATQPAAELTDRGEKVRTWIARQQAPGRFVTWETAAVPDHVDTKTVTFAFSGTLGWMSEPEVPFVLVLDDQPALEFDVVGQSATWHSTDGSVVLRFERSSANGADTHGTFYLTVPADRTQPGKPLLLTVRGKGGSMRWFGLHEYSDVVEWATRLR